jgi:hypothetical protein
MSPFAQTLLSQAKKTHVLIAWVRTHVFVLNVVGLSVIVLLCGAYIVQVNQAVAKGYQMRQFEDQIEELTLRNQQLEIAVREAKSLEHVTHAVKMMGLVESDQPTYMQSTPPSLAMAE